MTSQSILHDSSVSHVTGKSEYVDDRPMLKNELFVGLVWSPHARARITKLETSLALSVPGVHCVITADDVHHNLWGTIFLDQPIIAGKDVQFVGEVVAVVGAETRETLAQGLKGVVVTWEKLPAILSIDDAIAQKSFIGSERLIERGDVASSMQEAPRSLSNRLIIQGADHFYLENQAAVVYPKECGGLEVHSSTQHPTETQHVVAEACGLAFSDVVCITKRLGGGFGGKESQAAPIAAYAALVAQKTKRPARLVLSKDDDMIITGKRNPFQIDYKVGFDNEGHILGLDASFFSDGGAYADLSTAIMERALLHADNAYFIPHIKVRGQVCRLNIHPHTAFRGFGGPKGVAMIEGLIEDIAHILGKDPLELRKLNCYKPGKDTTHYDQTVENNLLPQLFSRLEKHCEYQARRREIQLANTQPGTNPRGLSMTAVKFGISFTTRFLNQGNALIILHTDGSIQASTGAVEMGQGVNTRIAALVAEQFGVDISKIRMMPTSTDKNANTSPTAASSGTDLNGAAAVVACESLRKRLGSLFLRLSKIPREKWASLTAGLGTMPEIGLAGEDNSEHVQFENGKVLFQGFQLTFAELVREAYLNRIQLSEYGFYKIPDLGFNKLQGKGRAFLYFTQGVAASEVEIDRYTGEVKVKRVDILMDLGKPINEALDLGQVRGGFVQGMGWMSTENLVYSSSGFLLTHSPSTYKIPSVQDTPRVFNVDLMPNNESSASLRGSKASGEPPLLLALSVWTAIKDALYGKRADGAKNLAIPATAERVLRALSPEKFAEFKNEPSVP